jgi:2-methylcitrate dehydratase
MLNRDGYVEAIVDAVLGTRFDSLPAEVLEATRLRIVDSIGCALSGLDTEAGGLGWRVATADPGAGVPVLGRPGRVSLESAALCTTAAIRSEDYNDSYNGVGSGHPSDLIGTALAVGSHRDVSTAELVAAVAGAYDALCRLWDHFRTGLGVWDQGTMVGPVAAALAARLLGLDRVQTGHAVSIAAVSSISIRQTRRGQLSVWKNFATAQASKNGVAAALLASAGAEGPDQPYVGAFGVATAIHDGPSGLELRRGAITETNLKLLPCWWHAHVPVEMAILGRRVVDLDKVDRIRVSGYARAVSGASADPEKRRPTTSSTADHSLPYLVAAALRFGRVDHDTFTPERWSDPVTLALVDKVEMVEDPRRTDLFPAQTGGSLEIWAGGTDPVFADSRDYPLGHHLRQGSAREIEDKFVELGQRVSVRGDVRTELGELYSECLELDGATHTLEVVERATAIVGPRDA